MPASRGGRGAAMQAPARPQAEPPHRPRLRPPRSPSASLRDEPRQPHRGPPATPAPLRAVRSIADRNRPFDQGRLEARDGGRYSLVSGVREPVSISGGLAARGVRGIMAMRRTRYSWGIGAHRQPPRHRENFNGRDTLRRCTVGHLGGFADPAARKPVSLHLPHVLEPVSELAKAPVPWHVSARQSAIHRTGHLVFKRANPTVSTQHPIC